jgi:hypothetical protein
MAPHTYTVTVTKDDFTETFTEKSVSKIFLRLKQHVELKDPSSKAFGMKYISRNCKHENFTIEVTDRDKIPPSESKRNYSKKKYYQTQSELQELQVLRQRVAELEEVLKQHNITV